jgi:nitrate/nitrite transporter NarK
MIWMLGDPSRAPYSAASGAGCRVKYEARRYISKTGHQVGNRPVPTATIGKDSERDLSTFFLAFVSSPVAAVALLSSTLFFMRWAGLYWSIPATLTDRARAGVVGGMMNFAGNVGGILVPIIVGVIVQVTGSYFLALMFFSASGVLYLISSLMIDYSRKLPV